MNDATRNHYARIMCEGGCSVEDIAVTLGMLLHEAVLAIAPSLKCNHKERRRVAHLAVKLRLNTPAIHKRNSMRVAVGEWSPETQRRAA